MDERSNRKYRRILEIMRDVAGCVDQKMILVGGTALALFYLKHRVSVDLDFVPVQGDEIKLKEITKGCLTKKGYKTGPGAYKNQFVIQFSDTSIKFEIFHSEHKINNINEFPFGISKVQVASLEDIVQMKVITYQNRKEARDLYDLIIAFKHKKISHQTLRDLIKNSGPPINEEELKDLITDKKYYKFYKEVFEDVSKTSD